MVNTERQFSPMPAIDINRWMMRELDRLQQSRQRQLVLLQGSQAWCDGELGKLDFEPLIFSDRGLHPGAIGLAAAAACLGRESRTVALDLFDGFDPDLLCIAAGIVRAGGILLLLLPRERNPARDRFGRWQDGAHASEAWFVDYFLQQVEGDPEVGLVFAEGAGYPSAPPLPRLQPTPIERGQTPEQAQAIERACGWLRGADAGTVLLSADRGRGKSTCLGMLAQRLQTELAGPILVTASSRLTAANLLQQAPAVEFVAPDRLLSTCPPADLILIDEAAKIPQSILCQLLRLYPRQVMATTTAGYEGTGQGFRLRFVDRLERGNLLHLRIEHPVRWCAGDALERWLNRVLMLDADGGACTGDDSAQVTIERLDALGKPSQLQLLRQVYALMSSAHYRTRPSDLRMLMENPDLVVLAARCGERVIGVAILNLEGGFDADLCEQVYQGRRRPRGHLLAQMLTAQAGAARFAAWRGARVQRIAVAADWRRRGVGSRLLASCLEHARAQGLDYVGAAFALDPETTGFWRRAGFELVHVSYAQGKSSGNQSVAVLVALNSALQPNIDYLQRRLQRQLPVWLTQFLARLEADHVVALLRLAAYRAELDAAEMREVESFAHGQKGFELCFFNLQRFVMSAIARGGEGAPLLIEKAVQNRDWRQLRRESGDLGRRQLQHRLRRLVDDLIKGC